MEKLSQKTRDAVALFLVIGVIALGVLSILREKIVQNETSEMSVSAEGKIYAKPDIANITFGVKVEVKKKAEDAVNEGTLKMNRVMEVFKKIGIEEKDMKTTGYNLRPVYSYPKESGARILSGYELDQQITLKIRNLEKIGEIIKEGTIAGANQSGGINFTIDDPEELRKQARAEAIKKAKEKAKEIETESGIKLDRIINVHEGSSYLPDISFSNSFAYASDKSIGRGENVSIPDIESGEMEVKINITLVYKVK